MRVDLPHPSRPNVYWHAPSNVGDALSGWLATKISGHRVRFTHYRWREPKVFVTGSIMSIADSTTTVWGAGIAWKDDKIDPRCRILAVRGPLTAARARSCGASCPDVFGDPALLMPRLYTPPQPPYKRRLGIVPHLVDRNKVFKAFGHNPAVQLVDVTRTPERVADELSRCDAVVSSSLHGLILAAAYQIPFGWVEFSSGVVGDGTKFFDFYASIGRTARAPLDCRALPSVDAMLSSIDDRPVFIDLEPLWQACPFRSDASS